jgi:hypothetical protein
MPPKAVLKKHIYKTSITVESCTEPPSDLFYVRKYEILAHGYINKF